MASLWTPFSFSLSFALLFAALFEPVRLALLPYYPHVLGGVGGVGGLANLQGPEVGCSAYQSPGYQENYCYQKGIWGSPFTILAWVIILCWVGPWFVGTSASALRKTPGRTTATTRQTSNDGESPNTVIRSFLFVSFQVFWIGINALWFLVPLAVFWNSLKRVEEITSLARYVLAISLAAAHPLSWNLMIVAMPVSGVLTLLVDSVRSDMFLHHRFVAYTTALWACLHGTFEVIYLVISKSPTSIAHHSKFFTALNFWQDGENLIYVFGLLAYAVFGCHVVASYFRKRFWNVNSFSCIHRMTALLLLMLAAAHWWPFALLCLPVTALHGCGAAIHIFYAQRRSNLTHPQQQEETEGQSDHLLVVPMNPPLHVAMVTANSSLCKIPFLITRRKAAVLLLLSLVASWMGLYMVWSWRQAYMMSPSANLYVPFAFPPLSILMSGLASLAAVLIVLTLTGANEVEADTNADESTTTTPLLHANESHHALESGGGDE